MNQLPLRNSSYVEIPLNPYQGLKHDLQPMAIAGEIQVEIPLNPYQGLKPLPGSKGLVGNLSKFLLIPIRD